ncbi:MAG: glycosyltransferase family 39 protein [Clostridia bacterium]|nr:glycosyltransferase family 39 protein [Clostridia bacterium]
MLKEQHSSALSQNSCRNARLLRAFHIAVIALSAVVYIGSALFEGIWFDEAYTVGAVSNDMGYMIKYLTYDVHPHLYYMVLKIWSYVFGNSVIALRMFSAVFGVACVALGYTHIRRDFGNEVGFWFSFLLLFSFSTLKYALQIRMYTFAIFLLTLTALYAWRSKNGGGRKERALFLIFSVLSAYTHYFAFFIVAMINVFTLIGAIASDDKKKALNSWFFDAFIQFASYAAGLAVFLFQISLGGADWIRLEFPNVIYDTVIHFFTGAPLLDDFAFGSSLYNAIGVVLTIIFAETFIRLRFLFKTEKEKYRAPFLSYAVCMAVFGFTVAVSFFRPIYYARYAICFSGFLFFSAAFLLACSKKIIKTVAAIVLVVCFLFSAVPFWQENYSENNLSYDEQLDVQEGDIFVADDFHSFVCTVEFPEHRVVFYNLWGWPVDKTYRLFGDNVEIMQDISELNEHSGRIWTCGAAAFEYFDKLENATFVCEKRTHTDYYNYDLTFRLYEIE